MILEDKVVVVTGVGPGLGRSMALAAAEEGARVVCMARTEAFVAKVVDEITGQGGEALRGARRHHVDRRLARVVSETERRFGRLDGLVNSAFTAGPIALFEDADLDAWRQVFEVNVFGTLSMIRAALTLLSRDGGRRGRERQHDERDAADEDAGRLRRFEGRARVPHPPARGGARRRTVCAATPCTAARCSGRTCPMPWTSGPSGAARVARRSRPRWRRTWPSAASPPTRERTRDDAVALGPCRDRHRRRAARHGRRVAREPDLTRRPRADVTIERLTSGRTVGSKRETRWALSH